ncbi:MAG: flagellin [Calditrichaeota bacterium]|nr:flagellin [Calditrichota bacterium]MCB0268717.1 flagellin [Calditrichota bacterium]MCB0285051.1 flagellin [Calditrichota bacterium]MCB0301155.1 flagellin [Calditrichota bacterium]MCB9066983.1 flagellin [Calditrichia bacterium]
MAFYSGSRINTNVGALNALNALNTLNSKIGTHQLRLASGKRINSAADDPAGYTISQKLVARSRSLSAALNNVGEAKNILSVAEGGLQSINDLFVGMKEKVIQAGNGSYGSEELAAVVTQLQDMLNEIDDAISETKFNGTNLLNASFTSKLFQTGADGGDTMTISLSATIDSADFSLNSLTSASLQGTALTTTLTSIDSAISSISIELQKVGSYMQRLDVKEQTLQVAMTNTDAAASRIMDADVAKEQLELTKLQILQQTATIQLTQANSAPQNILQLFGG